MNCKFLSRDLGRIAATQKKEAKKAIFNYRPAAAGFFIIWKNKD